MTFGINDSLQMLKRKFAASERFSGEKTNRIPNPSNKRKPYQIKGSEIVAQRLFCNLLHSLTTLTLIVLTSLSVKTKISHTLLRLE